MMKDLTYCTLLSVCCIYPLLQTASCQNFSSLRKWTVLEFFLFKHVNQDPLEKFFGFQMQVGQGNNTQALKML